MYDEMTLEGALIIIGASLIFMVIAFFKGWTVYEIVWEDEDEEQRK